ncbi:MAG: HD domain-containing protein, partial [Gemmatimonadales bacterium]
MDPDALAVLDTPAVQRLRYVRQLGHAFLVYPGATHSRLEHALGTYHLARRVLGLLEEQGGHRRQWAEEEGTAIRLAALLHDVGHYPFSHALEEAGFPHHETLAERHLQSPALKAALDALGLPGLGSRLLELIRGTSASPLAGLIAGSLDLDKIEYLTRDAWMCGVPYGAIDADRLLTSLTIAAAGDGAPRVGIHEKGISALESLLFAKYQMYRNVYW